MKKPRAPPIYNLLKQERFIKEPFPRGGVRRG
jgi:hypothetical protein